MGFIVIYVTNADETEARKIGRHCLEKRLAACVNYFPIQSSYWWEGKIKGENEVVCLLKAPESNWPGIRDEIKKIHPYSTPCIIKFNVEANKEFEAWVAGECSIK